MSTNALHSLYGGKDARALAGNVGGQVRKQEVWTPLFIREAAEKALGGPIVLDPCAATDPAGHFAEFNLTVDLPTQALERELEACTDKARKAVLAKQLKAAYLAGPGLTYDWDIPGGRYINPVYGLLEAWLKKCTDEAKARPWPQVLLIPFRPQRKWFGRLLAGVELVALEPFAFVGHKQAFPAPIVLLGLHCTIPPLGRRETGRYVCR